MYEISDIYDLMFLKTDYYIVTYILLLRKALLQELCNISGTGLDALIITFHVKRRNVNYFIYSFNFLNALPECINILSSKLYNG